MEAVKLFFNPTTVVITVVVGFFIFAFFSDTQIFF